jgi:hypothetical protein
MKTLFTLAAAALLATMTGAPALAAPPANLTITAERGQPFSLVLDGRLLTRPVARQVHVGLLPAGRHWAEFSMPTAYGPPLRFRTMVWLQPGLETDYVLVMRPYGPQLRQVGVLPLGSPGYGGPAGYYGQSGAPYGNAPGGYYNPGQQPAPTQGGYDNDPDYDPRNAPGSGQGGYNQPAPAYPGSQPGGYPAPTPTYPGGYGNAPGSYPSPGSGGYYPGSGAATNLQPLEQGDAADLAQDLRQRPTEAERLRTATEALTQRSLRAEELTELLHTFTHDESRIEFARFGYAHLSDPQNFSRVYSALQFKSSVRALQQAVGLPQD